MAALIVPRLSGWHSKTRRQNTLKLAVSTVSSTGAKLSWLIGLGAGSTTGCQKKSRRRWMRPDILTPGEVAEEWGCSEQHVRNMVNRGELGHFRLGGKLLRIPRSAVEAAECAVISAPMTSDGSRPRDFPEANALSPSTKRVSDTGSGSAQIMRLRQSVVRQRFTPRP
ncbi:DNA-binding protein [Methylobacterium sp. P1-11]|nr:DNA-binding protein [Methylobacterium sp. P1-11]